MSAISRAIKQELLEGILPEVYMLPETRRRIQAEGRAKVDVKTLVKAKSKAARAARRAKDDEVEFVRQSAPRRPYNWRGRRVRAVVRPGVPVVFTPGQRSSVRAKRVFDEVYADSDLLDQAEARDNEFAYGKRARILTDRNPTPSQVPLTDQQLVVAPGQARLLPTVQVLMSKDVKQESVLPVSKRESGDVKVEDHGVHPVAPGLGVQTVDIKVPLKRRRGGDDDLTAIKRIKDEGPLETTLKMEYAEPAEVTNFDPGVEPGTLFQTAATDAAVASARPIAVPRTRRRVMVNSQPPVEVMEVQQGAAAPATSVSPTAAAAAAAAAVGAASTSRWGPANNIFPDYRYHPSITVPARRNARRALRYGPANAILPDYRLHPSMLVTPPVARTVRTVRRRTTTRRLRRRRTTRRAAFVAPAYTSSGIPLPRGVRYHPTINVLTRSA
ncbi:minor coat protein [Equine adenovirus 1]|uniref:Minor coat protein n=1 Tax=Equine adenovirus A serotype 1 TaxID=46916 RepID=G5CZ84_ADEE1|nr:minor core protein [Equine adenovirus 1]AEP16415.1 minor core protein [Equine adenovirus 1]ANG08560.1 minor coat protein [Equine adenovirus 1]